jgi:hypothetical protein
LICRDAKSNSNYGLYIGFDSRGSDVEAKLIVKGEVTFNSNGGKGMNSYLFSDSKLDIAVLNDATLESCGNDDYDINGYVAASATATGAATFSGDGSYICDQTKVVFNGDGTVVGPVCQPCT